MAVISLRGSFGSHTLMDSCSITVLLQYLPQGVLMSCQNCVKSLSGRQAPSLAGTRFSCECFHFLAAPEDIGFSETR